MNKHTLYTLKTVMVIAIIIVLTSCKDISQTSQGPYFGNGLLNGWVDQESVTLLTRLTTTPEGNKDGAKFIEIDGKKFKGEWKHKKDRASLFDSQLPEGKTLSEMEGACPGSNGEVQITYFPKGEPDRAITLDWISVEEQRNYIRQWKLTNLQPGTTYQMQLLARKAAGYIPSDTLIGRFTTAPRADKQKDISFAIVSCHDYVRKDDSKGHKIYRAMAKDNLDFYVHTGDIEYYDKQNPWALTEDLMRFKWDRLLALPLQRDFYTNTSCYFMKDDHDVLADDAYPGMTYGQVDFKRGLEIFNEQFPTHETGYKTIRWGKDLQVWILEGRRYRSKNTDEDGPNKTILGKQQKEWLFSTVEASDATYKVIISATPILGPDRAFGKYDNHSNKNFQTEGNELREFFNQFDNVFMVNGDRHWQYATHFEGTNLWEFGCGSGSNKHAGGWPKAKDAKSNEGKMLPQHQFVRIAGGYLHGSVYHEDDSVKIQFEHRDVDGHVVFEKVFSQM